MLACVKPTSPARAPIRTVSASLTPTARSQKFRPNLLVFWKACSHEHARTLFPWQLDVWQQIWRERHRLPHALLLTGEAGLGKRRFAEYLAQFLLCEDPAKHDAPCGQCDACGWFLAGNHPDFRLLAPAEADEGEDEGKKRKLPVINVENVRALADFVNLTSHRQGLKVTIVDPAEAMNTAAANAFLKTFGRAACRRRCLFWFRITLRPFAADDPFALPRISLAFAPA